MKSKSHMFLIFFIVVIYNVFGQNINCPNVYLYGYDIECPTGPSLGISVHYPLQTEFDIKLIRTSTGEIVEEFTVTDPEGVNNSSFLHYFGVLESGNWSVTINSYEYYWGGELICEQTKDIELLTCDTLSVEEESWMNDVSFYPNPVSNILHIKTSHNIKSVTLYSVLGKHVFTALNKEIDVSQFQSGLYVLKVETEKGFVAKRLIIN